MNPKISIILPIFNVEKYLKDALESIINQSIGFKNLEIIMVNDCSTDKSGEIIDEYSNKYSNFKAIHLQNNNGAPGIPRNVGIEHSNGKYLMFLDPDDTYEKDACEILYNKINSENVDIVFGKYTAQYKNAEKNLKTNFDDFNDIKVDNINDQEEFLAMPPAVWSKIFKKSFIDSEGIKFSAGWGEDLFFVVKSFLKASGIIFTNENIVKYYIRNQEYKSNTFARNKKFIFDLIYTYNDIYSICRKNNNEKLFSVVIKGHLIYWLKQVILSELNYFEKKEALMLSTSLFEKYHSLGLNYEGNYLEPIFKNVIAKNYDEAALITNSLSDLLRNHEILEINTIEITRKLELKEKELNQIKQKIKFQEKQINSKNNEISDLKTIKGYTIYKSKNIIYRFKRKL